MAPILQDVKHKVGDAVSIIKIDVDKNPQAAQAYQVQGVPTLILFKDGQPVWRQSGVVQAKQLEQILNNNL
jgi:thioredoxin 1